MSQDWNTRNIPHLSGKTFLVTGANSGLGFGTTKELSRKGARVIMAVRSMEKGKNAKKEIQHELSKADLHLMQLDLADLENVMEFSRQFRSKFDRLDVLINNAGIMMPADRRETTQGFEIQWGTNHLGHMLLTNELLPLINEAPNGRVVTVSSLVAKMKNAKIYWEDIQFEKKYDRSAAYAQSKLANQMFGMELNAKLNATGASTQSILAHPGYTATNLQNTLGFMGKIGNFLLAQKLEMGILPTLRAATDPEAQGGEYYGPNKFYHMRGYPQLDELNPLAKDETERKKLWGISQGMIQRGLEN